MGQARLNQEVILPATVTKPLVAVPDVPGQEVGSPAARDLGPESTLGIWLAVGPSCLQRTGSHKENVCLGTLSNHAKPPVPWVWRTGWTVHRV